MARRRAGPRVQYDLSIAAGADARSLGADLVRHLREQGFCTVRTNTDRQLLQEALQEVGRLDAEGRWEQTPAVVVDGLLGEEGSGRSVPVPGLGDAQALERLDTLLGSAAGGLSLPDEAWELGFEFSGRTQGLLLEAGPLRAEPPDLTQADVAQWLGTFMWHRLMLIVFLGPGQGTLELQPFGQECWSHRIPTEPGMLVVLRADWFWHRYSAVGGYSYALSCFLQQARTSGQGVTCEPPRIPIADELDKWALDQIEAAVEDPEKLEKLDSRWVYAVEHMYHTGQQTAVRGVAGRYANTWDVEAFRHSFNGGVDAAANIPLARWDHTTYYDEDPDSWKRFKCNMKHGVFVDGIDLFDNRFFRISPAETKGMDPMQRQILEVGYESLVSAGRNTKTLLQSLTAVYVGCHVSEFPLIDAGPMEAGGCEQRSAGTGFAGSIMANRFSFVFGMNGPSVQFDVDAASSLAVLEVGVTALDERRVNATTSCCIGVSVMLTPLTWLHRIGLGHMCVTGRSLSFDQSASGWVRAESTGALAIDNLMERVEGVLVQDETRGYLGTLGSVKMSHLGQMAALGAPCGPALQGLVAEACRQARVSPSSIDAVECMADGQHMHDAVEVASMCRFLGGQDRLPLGLSSLKSGYGNSIQGSGMAQIIKVLFSQAYGWQAPSVHLRQLNPQIEDMSESSICITSEMLLYPTRTSLVGVTSIGWGGTMGHAVCSCGIDPNRIAPPRPAWTYNYAEQPWQDGVDEEGAKTAAEHPQDNGG